MRILMTGATGLVGQGVLQTLLAAPEVRTVAVLGRRPTGLRDPRLVELTVTGFEDLTPIERRLTPFDACVYCAGAPPIGTPESTYHHVTHTLTLNVARSFAARNPQGHFLYVSGAFAGSGRAFMPLRVKGEIEEALQALPIRTTMLRPGGVQPVLGEQSPHGWMRPLYAFGGPVMGLGVRFAPSLWTTTAAIGRAMLALARMRDPPAIVENAEINRIGAAG